MSAALPAEVIVGLDVGTTGVKAVAFGLGSSWRRVAIREYPLSTPAPHEEVQDPAVILAAAREALTECVAAASGAEVIAVSVSAAMHGLLGLDSALAPLTPLITWADSRAHDEARALRRSGPDLHGLTGAPVHPMTPVTKLMWFARHERQTLARARWWVGLKELLLAWLTGRLVTEPSSASGTGMLELGTRSWCEAAIEVAGVSADQLPEILPAASRLPLAAAVAQATGLAAGTPVVLGAGDGPLANLGTGAIVPGVAGLSIGTSGAVRMVVERARVDDRRTLFCYALTDSTWVVGGAISNGGVVARWAEASLAPDLRGEGDSRPDEALLALAATAPPGSDGLVMLPYLLAERAPLWDPDLPGAYLGLRHDHTRAHLVRAALEGVCIQMRLILDRLDAVAPVDSVRATGGVFRAALWREVMAAMLGRPLEVIGEAEGTALGAAALGLLALGRAATPAGALALLADPGAACAPQVRADAEVVATYDLLRASIPGRVAELERVAGLFVD